ncbi:Structural maintenance of chromosomes protein 3 [Elasticomyces elasticus]|nr:Structural maintenance of chromosomes protein 3 [Elasticomyces elasticus]
MSHEERGGLLHEGAGPAVMSAYVEVIFDNADQRFSTDTAEVILRRTIGQKKDEYSLNRKEYDAPGGGERAEDGRGRITAITNMPDAGRLDILKEVAGTKVYEERRAASQKIMDDTEHRRTKIDESLDHIRGRLALQEALEKLEGDREGGVEQTDDDREALQCGELKLEKIDAKISELHSQIKLLSAERAQLEDERRDIAKQKAKIELDVQTTIDNQISAQEAHTKHADDLRTVQEQISEREAEHSQLLPEYTAKRKQERALRQQITDADHWLELVLELTVTIRSKTRNERLKLCPCSCFYSNLPQG